MNSKTKSHTLARKATTGKQTNPSSAGLDSPFVKLTTTQRTSLRTLIDGTGFAVPPSRTKKLGNPGTTVLFSGSDTSGKINAAIALANQTRAPLYRIDLNRVVSKYIEETEKNLEMVFTDAERQQAILFFDEADALFGKRSSVKEGKGGEEGNDRFENAAIDYLFSLIEAHPGIVILSSNSKQNIDKKYLRRLRLTINFAA